MNVNGKEVDFSKALPMTLGDVRKLKQAGVDLNEFTAAEKEERMPDIEMMCSMFFHFAHKANPEITADDIDKVEIDRVEEITIQLFANEKPEDRPT